MNKTRYIAVVALITVLLCGASLCFTSCYQPPTTIIDPVDDVTVSTTNGTEVGETYVTRPTVAVPEGQLTITDLMTLHEVTMPWSAIEGYTHEMTGENTAHFSVADGYGEECSLDVVIDFESGLLTEATLSYGDISENLLTYYNQGVTRILTAMANNA